MVALKDSWTGNKKSKEIMELKKDCHQMALWLKNREILLGRVHDRLRVRLFEMGPLIVPGSEKLVSECRQICRELMEFHEKWDG